MELLGCVPFIAGHFPTMTAIDLINILEVATKKMAND